MPTATAATATDTQRYSATKSAPLNRLRRIEGQGRGVHGMVEGEREPSPRQGEIAVVPAGA